MGELVLLQARIREVGGSKVRRLLPSARRKAVGPFLFFDHFGPEERKPFEAFDIGPHPHIGLSTVTYLFEGRLLHRDSLGSVQAIVPGEINWMTAGRGIAHSERTPPELVGLPRRVHGLQLWAGLPKTLEEAAPIFAHTPVTALPMQQRNRAVVRTLIGRAWDTESPVVATSETIYLDIELPERGRLDLPPLAAERALYGVDNAYTVNGQRVEPLMLALLEPGETVRVESEAPARLVLIGGEPLDGARFMWWNFVSTSRERIVAAAEQWASDHSPRIPGESEWVPLPGRPRFL